MAKYVLLYRGGSMPETDEARAAVMQAWEAWFAQLGSAVADPGDAFAPASKRIAPDGGVGEGGAGATGYTILHADSLDAAVTLAKGCPVLQGGAAIDVYETLGVM